MTDQNHQDYYYQVWCSGIHKGDLDFRCVFESLYTEEAERVADFIKSRPDFKGVQIIVETDPYEGCFHYPTWFNTPSPSLEQIEEQIQTINAAMDFFYLLPQCEDRDLFFQVWACDEGSNPVMKWETEDPEEAHCVANWYAHQYTWLDVDVAHEPYSLKRERERLNDYFKF